MNLIPCRFAIVAAGISLHKADHSMGEYQTMIRWHGDVINALSVRTRYLPAFLSNLHEFLSSEEMAIGRH